MFEEEVARVGELAKKKVKFLKDNSLGYVLLAILAGTFISLATIFAFTVASHVESTSWKLILAITFSMAFILITFAGSELFTSSTFVSAMGFLKRKITFGQLVKILVVCYISNIIGIFIITALAYAGGYLFEGAFIELIMKVSISKGSWNVVELLSRAMLCNFVVCVAAWCTYKINSEPAKLLILIGCVTLFVTSGFEHSIANIAMYSLALVSPIASDFGVTPAMALYNISLATIGNLIGSTIFLALPYHIISNTKNKR